MFQFKKFAVDQTGCAMKINTDGVLLGALAEADQPKTILDIGTGTGVIALMLAQRYGEAQIDAVEIDEIAAKTAENNFKNSPFSGRLTGYSMGFEHFFEQNPAKRYDMIVSNPPFFINSLKSSEAKRGLAKHTDETFFKRLISITAKHLNPKGIFWLVLPIDTSKKIKQVSEERSMVIKQIIDVCSYPDSIPHREIIALSLEESETIKSKFVIYDMPNKYSEQYQEALKDFFIIF